MNYNPADKLECYYGSITRIMAERKRKKTTN